MTKSSSSTGPSIKKQAFDSIAIRISMGVLGFILLVALFLWVAGSLIWVPGWLYIGLLTCCHSISALYLWRKNPEMLRSRAKIGKGTKPWDKIVLSLFGTMYLAIAVVAALDAGRFRISGMPFWLWPVGAIMYCFFLIVTTWAMAVNPFFEKTVRIQQDRGHQVIDTGPYRIVRHPGYIATIIGFIFATPFLLGSWWSFVPAGIAAASLIVRTYLEDLTLQKELPGYALYAQRVCYRLIPGIW
jgi:protein-S-isoprenylcysteine O-methyltransferase Ste14